MTVQRPRSLCFPAVSRPLAGLAPCLVLSVALGPLAACSGTARQDGEAHQAAPAGPATEPATRPAADLRIAYNVWADPEADDYEVFVMDLDGGGRRNLTAHPAVDWVYRAWGERLYLVSDRDGEKRKYGLYEMTLADPTPRRLGELRVRDSWLGFRDEGRQIAVASDKDGHPDLYLIDRDGRELRRLTADEHYDNDPAISPDGRWLAWRSRRSGLDELWLMDLDAPDPAATVRQLTRFPEDDPAYGEHGYHAGPPAWVPGGERISFCSKRGGDTSIYTVRPDGTDLTRLSPAGSDECWHDWSPDGRWLAYDSNADPEGGYDIWLLEVATGEVTQLTAGAETEQAPVFVRGG